MFIPEFCNVLIIGLFTCALLNTVSPTPNVFQRIKRKCCSNSEIYDYGRKICVPNYNVAFFEHSNGQPTCEEDSTVMVVLESKRNKLEVFSNLTLHANIRNMLFTTETYCADSTSNSSLWIAIACLEVADCLPHTNCIRKCFDNQLLLKELRQAKALSPSPTVLAPPMNFTLTTYPLCSDYPVKSNQSLGKFCYSKDSCEESRCIQQCQDNGIASFQLAIATDDATYDPIKECRKCEGTEFELDPLTELEDEFFIQPNGSLYFTYKRTHIRPDQYSIRHSGQLHRMQIIVCLNRLPEDTKRL